MDNFESISVLNYYSNITSINESSSIYYISSSITVWWQNRQQSV